VIALEKLLSEPYITQEEREMILKEMKKKCQILTEGFSKRGKEIEARYYQEVMKRHGIEI
jgi:hypothetical protein